MRTSDTGKDRVSSLAASATRAALRLLSGVWVARTCGEALFGTYALLLSVETILFTVVGCLAAAPLANLVPKLGVERGERLWHSLLPKLRTVSLCAGTGVFLVCCALPGVGVAVGFCVALSYACGLQLAVHRAYHASVYRSARVWEAECWTFGLPLLGVALTPGLPGWQVFWLGNALGAGIACWRLRPRGRREAASPLEHPDFRPLGRTLLLGSLAYTVGSRLHVFVLAAVAGPTQVGLFAAALSLAGPLRLGSMALGNLLRPRVVQALGGGEADRARRWTRAALGILLAAGCTGLATSLLLGEWTVRLLYGGALAGLPQVLPWALAYVTCEAFGSVLVVVAQGHGSEGARCATRLRFLVAAVSVVALVPVCRLGATPALIVLLVLELGFALGMARVVQRRWPQPTPTAQRATHRLEPVLS